MKAALVIGGLGIVLVVLTPALRALRLRPNSKRSDEEYFAAARKRAISYRLAKTENTRDPSQRTSKALG